MKLNKQTIIFLIVTSMVAANAVHWTIALLFYDGRMDVNALRNQGGWAIGEGWFEVLMYSVTAYYGFREIPKLKKA